jgi:hypothetical protein
MQIHIDAKSRIVHFCPNPVALFVYLLPYKVGHHTNNVEANVF